MPGDQGEILTKLAAPARLRQIAEISDKTWTGLRTWVAGEFGFSHDFLATERVDIETPNNLEALKAVIVRDNPQAGKDEYAQYGCLVSLLRDFAARHLPEDAYELPGHKGWYYRVADGANQYVHFTEEGILEWTDRHPGRPAEEPEFSAPAPQAIYPVERWEADKCWTTQRPDGEWVYMWGVDEAEARALPLDRWASSASFTAWTRSRMGLPDDKAIEPVPGWASCWMLRLPQGDWVYLWQVHRAEASQTPVAAWKGRWAFERWAEDFSARARQEKKSAAPGERAGTALLGGHGRALGTETFVPIGLTVLFYAELDTVLPKGFESLALRAGLDPRTAGQGHMYEQGDPIPNYSFSRMYERDTALVVQGSGVAADRWWFVGYTPQAPNGVALCSQPKECEVARRSSGEHALECGGLLNTARVRELRIASCRGQSGAQEKKKSRLVGAEDAEDYGKRSKERVPDLERRMSSYPSRRAVIKEFEDMAPEEQAAILLASPKINGMLRRFHGEEAPSPSRVKKKLASLGLPELRKIYTAWQFPPGEPSSWPEGRSLFRTRLREAADQADNVTEHLYLLRRSRSSGRSDSRALGGHLQALRSALEDLQADPLLAASGLPADGPGPDNRTLLRRLHGTIDQLLPYLNSTIDLLLGASESAE